MFVDGRAAGQFLYLIFQYRSRFAALTTNLNPMPKTSRELLLTTKAARQWQDELDQKVSQIIEVINGVDTPQEVERVSEVLDIYHHTLIHTTIPTRRRNRVLHGERPFEFMAFRN